MSRTMRTVGLAALAALAAPAGADPPVAVRADPADVLAAQAKTADVVLIGTVTSAKVTGVARSLPPIYMMQLTFKARRVLKGTFNPDRAYGYSARQMQQPQFPADKSYAVLLKITAVRRGVRMQRASVVAIAEATPRVIKALEAALGAAAEQPDKAADRAAKLKANIDSFRLDLELIAGRMTIEKPYYSLTLYAGAIEQIKRTPFEPAVHVDKNAAAKIIDHLAAEGFLAAAAERDTSLKVQRIPPAGPTYLLRVGRIGQWVVLEQSLGWNLAMLGRLDGLRKVLDGDAAKAMDLLLGRLAGHRRLWEAVPPAAGAVELFGGDEWYKSQEGPEQEFEGVVVKLPAAGQPTIYMRFNPFRLKMDKSQREIYVGGKPAVLEPFVGKRVRITGKAVDMTVEGKTFYEVWPARLTVLGAPPDGGAGRPADEKEVLSLIRQLGDESWRVRQAATEKLTKMGKAAHGALKAAREQKGLDPEVAQRIDTILGAAAAEGGTSVTDPDTGITVTIEDGGRVIAASKDGKTIWKAMPRGQATSVKIVNGMVQVMPANVFIHLPTGKIISVGQPPVIHFRRAAPVEERAAADAAVKKALERAAERSRD